MMLPLVQSLTNLKSGGLSLLQKCASGGLHSFVDAILGTCTLEDGRKLRYGLYRRSFYHHLVKISHTKY
jgi:hypothetical protein